MDDFENKTPEMQEPASSEDNIPETPETAETIPAEPTVSDEPAAPAEPTVTPEPTVSDAPTAEPLPNAEQAPEAQPIPNVNIPPQPQPGQYPPPYGQGAYPPPYPQNMQNPYPHPAPQKRKMPLGLRILIIVMSVLVAGSVIGFASYGIYAAVNRGYGVTTLPGDPLIPNFPHENDGSDSETPDTDDSFTPPDIAVTPNTEGITLDKEPNTAELDIDAVYDKVIPSTVLVITQSGETQGTGTGIFATEDGYIITNSHVILNSKSVSVQVKTYDGELHDAVVVGFDKTTDLAVLKIDGTGYMPAEFGDSDDLRMGQWVVAIGNPGGEQFSGSITRGVISGLNRSVGSYSSNGMTYIQTDAAINPGNSGGPLVNLHGQVIGISSAKIVSEQYEGMGFAIPITGAKSIIDDLLAGGYVQGRVRFGIKGTAITQMQAAMYDVPQGFMISEIDEDSCFNGTDVQAYDIITAIDDTETKSLEELANALLNYKPGDTAEIHLFRPNESGVGGEEFTVTVTLLEDKGETQG